MKAVLGSPGMWDAIVALKAMDSAKNVGQMAAPDLCVLLELGTCHLCKRLHNSFFVLNYWWFCCAISQDYLAWRYFDLHSDF